MTSNLKTILSAAAIAALVPFAASADTIGSSTTKMDPVNATPEEITVQDGDVNAVNRDTTNEGAAIPADATTGENTNTEETEIVRDTSDEGLAKPADATQ